MNDELAWYKVRCLGCDLWHPVRLAVDSRRWSPKCPNCTQRWIDIEAIESIPAELGERWSFATAEILDQEEMVKMLALRTKHGKHLEIINE